MATLTLTPLNSTGIPGTTVRYTANIVGGPFGTLSCKWYVNDVLQAGTTRFFNYVAAGRDGVKTIRCVGTFTPTEGDPTPQVYEASTTFTVTGNPTTLSVALKISKVDDSGDIPGDVSEVVFGQKLSYTAEISGDDGPGTYAYEFFTNGERSFTHSSNRYSSWVTFRNENTKPVRFYNSYVTVTFTPVDGDTPVVFTSLPVTVFIKEYNYYPEIKLVYDQQKEVVRAEFTPEIPPGYEFLPTESEMHMATFWYINGMYDDLQRFTFEYPVAQYNGNFEIMFYMDVFYKDGESAVLRTDMVELISELTPGPGGGCEDFYIHPLPHRDSAYAWVSWWLAEEIHKMTLAGKDWKTDQTGKYWHKRCTLAKMLVDYPNVEVHESRHGKLLKREHFESGHIYDYYKY